MKGKILRKLAVGVMALMLVCFAGVSLAWTSRADAEENTQSSVLAEWSDRKNGGSATVDGAEWTVGGFNIDYYRGIDSDGNIAFENVPYGSNQDNPNYGIAFKGGSNQKVLLDGLNLKFKIESETQLAAGAHVVIGFDKTAQAGAPMLGFTFMMQEDGTFAMYMNGADHRLYEGDSRWIYHEEDKTPENILTNLYNAGAKVTAPVIRQGDEIHIQLKYMSSASRSAYGLQHPQFDAFVLLVNGNAYYYLPGTENKPYPIGSETFDKDSDDEYYGYLSIFGNAAGELLKAIPSPAELTSTENSAEENANKNVRARITFTDYCFDGTDSGMSIPAQASTARTGFVATQTGYEYATVSNGKYEGKTAIYKGTTEIGYRTSVAADIGGFAYSADFKAAHKYDAQNPDKVTYKFLSSLEVGADELNIELVRTGESTAQIKCDALNSVYNLTDADFRKGYPFELSLFADDTATVITANGQVVAMGDPLEGFADGTAYFELEGSGIDRIVEREIVTDGTAVRKTIVKAIDTSIFADTEIAYKGTFTPASEKVTLTKEDDTTFEANVTYDISKLNTAAPGEYVLPVSFTDASVLNEYIITESQLSAMKVKVSVQYPDGYIKFLSEDYRTKRDNKEYTFDDESNLTQNFIYKKENGVDYFMGDGFANTQQFMPVDYTKKDIDGYSIDFTLKNHAGANKLVVIGLMVNTKHFNQEYVNLGIQLASGNGVVVYSNNTYSGGAAEVAYLVNVENAEEKIHGPNFNLDWTGETEYNLSYEVIDEDLHMYLSADDKKYEVYRGDSVTPKTVPASSYAGGKGYLCVWSEQGYNEITVKQNYTRYATAFETPKDTIVDFGQEHGLPATTKLTLNDGSKIDGKITYTGEYDKEKAGQYTLKGTVSYDGAAQLGNGETIWEDVDDNTFNVRVIVREEEKTITAITLPDDFSVDYGTNPQWSATVQATVHSAYFNTDTTETLSATFLCDNFNRFAAGEYEFTVSLTGSYKMADGVKTTVKVTVKPEEGGEDPDDNKDPNGGNTTESKKKKCGSLLGAQSAVLAAAIGIMLCAVVVAKKRRDEQK